MIYKSAHRLFVTFEGESCGREQFPVAVVSENGGACLPLVVIFFYLLRISEFYVLEQGLVADGEQLQCFHEIVAEPMIEPTFYFFQFLRCFLGE